MVLRLSALSIGHALLYRNVSYVSGTHFYSRLRKPQSLMGLEGTRNKFGKKVSLTKEKYIHHYVKAKLDLRHFYSVQFGSTWCPCSHLKKVILHIPDVPEYLWNMVYQPREEHIFSKGCETKIKV
jgi:hypothetical protein